MKFNIPKITQPIDLAGFAPEMVHEDGSPALVYVWVNPPAALMNTHSALRSRAMVVIKQISEAKGDKALLEAAAKELGEVGTGLHRVFAELWSQRSDPETRWTEDEVAALANNVENPALYGWLTSATVQAIIDYRKGLRKN